MNVVLIFVLILFPLEVFAGSRSSKGIEFSRLARDPDINGISFDRPEERTEIEQQFQDYLNFKSEFMNECQSTQQSKKSPFCDLVLTFSRKPGKTVAEKRARLKKIYQDILQIEKDGNGKAVAQWDENEIFTSLKKIKTLTRAKAIAKKVLARTECSSSALLMGLGIKIEDGFPNEDAKQLSIALYDRAFQCGKDTFALQAGYRMGLIHIWENRCEDSEKVFSQINDTFPNQDYRLRIAYWRLHCANEKKDEALSARMTLWLQKEYPLSLHRILSRQEPLGNDALLSKEIDPEVTFRTLLNDKMNTATRGIELLLAHGYLSSAATLLRANLEDTRKLEISFQLYWAVLLARSRSTSASFQLLSELFRENPEFISKATLALMYPLKGFDLIQTMELPVDPYLIVSLIRQESAFDEFARSQAGAFGLMQLQLATAKNFEKLTLKQLYDPETNIRVGVKYLKRLLDQYDGQLEFALAAYNAGPGRLKEWKRRYPIENRMLFVDLLPVRETREYISSIIRNYYWYLNIYAPKEAERRVASQSSKIVHSLNSR